MTDGENVQEKPGTNTVLHILALVLLAFTTRRMVRSSRLALSTFTFTAQIDFAVSDRNSYEKMHTSSLVRRDGIISAQV